MKDVSPRKSMGMGDGMPTASSMGISTDKVPGTDAMEHADANMNTSKTLGDANRGHTPPMSSGRSGRMAMPGEVDHGPHYDKGGRR